jgi:hypothetical protein
VLLLVITSPLEANIFPNPVTKKFSLEILTTQSQKIKLSVTNNDGKKMVSQEKNLVAGANEIHFNSAVWAKGIYIVRIILEDGSSRMMRFIK